jgi:hypothetical protein
MTAVEAIEIADGHDTALERFGHVIEAREPDKA